MLFFLSNKCSYYDWLQNRVQSRIFKVNVAEALFLTEVTGIFELIFHDE